MPCWTPGGIRLGFVGKISDGHWNNLQKSWVNGLIIWLVVTGTMEFYDCPIYWEESSQLTFTPSFFRGVGIPPIMVDLGNKRLGTNSSKNAQNPSAHNPSAHEHEEIIERDMMCVSIHRYAVTLKSIVGIRTF